MGGAKKKKEKNRYIKKNIIQRNPDKRPSTEGKERKSKADDTQKQ
jgi:hypothetical protein